MKELIRIYKWLNLLSFDVAAGAVVSGLFFGKLLEVSIPLSASFALALSVWMPTG